MAASRFERAQKQQFRGLAKRELRLLRDSPSPENSLRAARSLLTAYDAIADTSPERSKWACGAGCSYCCHMPVHLTAVEAIGIARHVLENLDETARDTAATRLAATAETIAGVSEGQFKDSRTACALLGDDGRCTVYEARPLACRGFHSRSVQVCKDSFDSNDVACDAARDRMTEDACARMVPAMHAVSRTGQFPNERYELNSALARLLEPGAKELPKDVAKALEGARARPSPLDVPLAAVIKRFSDP